MQTRSGQRYSFSTISSQLGTLTASPSVSPMSSPPLSPIPLSPLSLSSSSSFYNVNIDFEEASNAWKLNKKYTGNGCYKYKCIKTTKNGKACKNESLYNCDYCRYHINCRNI